MEYEIHEAATIEFHDPILGGLVTYTAQKGKTKPKSEAEAVALERLVASGLASRISDVSSDLPPAVTKPRTKTTTPASDEAHADKE
jgi:hypothetical protein